MAAKITLDEIQKINELYLQYGTYSAVAKEVGRASSTVKKYIDPNFQLSITATDLKEINWNELLSAPVINILEGEWDNECFLS